MKTAIIVAMARNRVIGKENQLPWHLPADLKRFKELTMGCPMIMGRKTWDSIGRPLPGRTSIVITRQPDFRAEGATVVPSLEVALAAGRRLGADRVCLIGGGEIYRQAIALTDVIYLTEVHTEVAGDAFFPELNPDEWREVERIHHSADEKHTFAFDFVRLERVEPLL